MNDIFETFLLSAYPSADGGFGWKILVGISVACLIAGIVIEFIKQKIGPWYVLPMWMWNDFQSLGIVLFIVFAVAAFALKERHENRSRVDQFLNDKDNRGLAEFHEKIDKDFLEKKEELTKEKGETP